MRNLKSLRFVLLFVLLLIAVNPVMGRQDDANVVVVPAGETIKVAVVTDLTGPIAEMGLDIQQGAEVALEEFNAAGGVEGWNVEFVVEDDRCSPDDGTLVANRIVADPQVVAVVGHVCSGATIAGSDLYEEARIPMVSPSATATLVTARGLDVMNRVAFSDGNQGTVDANYLYKVLGVRSLAIINDNDAYGLGLAEVVRDTFTDLGGEVVSFEGINVDDQDYRPVLTLVAAEEPEAIFFGGYKEQAILLIAQMQEVGLEDAIFFTDDGVYAQAFIDGAGDASEGAYASFVEEAEVNAERNEEFDATYEEMFNVAPDDQGPFHAHAYDSAMIIFNALKEVATVDDDGNLVIDREALIAAVRGTTDYEGLTGTLTCDENGDCGAGTIGINQVVDGEWAPVEVPADLLEMEAE
jgi:branched-chain amino acid transport system substrate-binding protein